MKETKKIFSELFYFFCFFFPQDIPLESKSPNPQRCVRVKQSSARMNKWKIK